MAKTSESSVVISANRRSRCIVSPSEIVDLAELSHQLINGRVTEFPHACCQSLGESSHLQVLACMCLSCRKCEAPKKLPSSTGMIKTQHYEDASRGHGLIDSECDEHILWLHVKRTNHSISSWFNQRKRKKQKQLGQQPKKRSQQCMKTKNGHLFQEMVVVHLCSHCTSNVVRLESVKHNREAHV